MKNPPSDPQIGGRGYVCWIVSQNASSAMERMAAVSR